MGNTEWEFSQKVEIALDKAAFIENWNILLAGLDRVAFMMPSLTALRMLFSY